MKVKGWQQLSDKQKTAAVVGVGALGGLLVLARGKSGNTSSAAPAGRTYSIPASAGGGGGGDLLGSSDGFNQDRGALASIIAGLSAQVQALSAQVGGVPTQLVAETQPLASAPAPAAAPSGTLTRQGWTGSFADLVTAVSSGQLFANVTDPVAKASLVQGLGNGGTLADSLAGARYAGQAAQQYAATNPAPTGEVLWTTPTNTEQGVLNKLAANPAL